jgi:hopanoid biosynthesis associated protein HpnK
VVTADDFGLSEEVNAAVETAHRNGILSAASLMVAGPAAADAVARAQRLPDLRVGLHLVLVDGDPVLDPTRIPDLIDGGGRLRCDFARFGVQIMIDGSVRRQVQQEIAAQFEQFRATGLRLDHVNAHRHFQLHPTVAAITIATGRSYGMRALRVPVEPRSIVATIDPKSETRLGLITAPWAAWLRRRARGAGLVIADAVFGLAWSGQMNRKRLKALIGRLPEGLVEIYLHPATTNAFSGAASGYGYTEEFAALCDAECIAAVKRSRHATGGYADARVA